MVHSPTVMHGLIRVLAAPAACAMLFAWLGALPAQAKITTRKFTVPITVLHGASPFDSDNCSAAAFVAFPAVKGAVSANVTYGSGKSLGSKGGSGPLFDDVFRYAKIYTAPSSKHWIVVSQSAADGGPPQDCSDLATKTRSFLPATARVTVNIDTVAACTAAKEARTQGTKDIVKVKKDAAMQTTDFGRANYAEYLKQYNGRRARAQAAVTRDC